MTMSLVVWSSELERRFFDDHDRIVDGSTPAQVVTSLDKMLHDNYLCLVESGKQQIKEVGSKTRAENSETKGTP